MHLNLLYWKLFNKLLDDNINSNIIKLLAFWYSNLGMLELCDYARA